MEEIELSIESKKKVKRIVEHLQTSFKLKEAREHFAETKRRRLQEQLEEISKNGLI